MKNCTVIFLLTVLCLTAPARATSTTPLARPTPINWNLKADQIKTSCLAQLKVAIKAATRLANTSGTRTFSNTVLPLENINSDLRDKLAAQRFLSLVSPDKHIRDASLDCDTRYTAFKADETSDPTLYRALVAARSGVSAPDVYGRKLTTLLIQTFEQSGAGLHCRRLLSVSP